MIRSLATADDWPLWRAARLAAITGAPTAFPNGASTWQTTGEDRWRQRLSDDAQLKVVAIQDDEPVGLVRGNIEPDAAWLSSLWVRQDQRGNGLAHTLITAVEQWARPQATTIKLNVVPGNARAIALYQRLGYRELGVRDDEFLQFQKLL